MPAADKPDWIVLDLDPDEALPYERVAEAALEVRDVLQSLGLTSWVKTTGGKGLHIVAPFSIRARLGRGEELRPSHRRRLRTTRAGAFTSTIGKAARRGRVLVDYLRNGEGATAVLYSPRARENLTVAMPIAWDDVGRVNPGAFTVRTVPSLLAKRRTDPWADFLTTRQTLPPPLEDVLARSRSGTRPARGSGDFEKAAKERGARKR